MSESAGRQRWVHTSQLLSAINNALGGKARPQDFMPVAFRREADGKQEKAPMVGIEALRVFLPKG